MIDRWDVKRLEGWLKLARTEGTSVIRIVSGDKPNTWLVSIEKEEGMIPENMEEWAGIDQDVRGEVTGLLEICKDSSEMNDPLHPKHDQYKRAVELARTILD